MTELKDGIKKIIQSGFVSKNIDSLIDDLAQRIADALVVDEIKVTQIISDVGNATRYDDDIGGVKVNPILWSVVPSASAKAISNAKPIKCEVGG